MGGAPFQRSYCKRCVICVFQSKKLEFDFRSCEQTKHLVALPRQTEALWVIRYSPNGCVCHAGWSI